MNRTAKSKSRRRAPAILATAIALLIVALAAPAAQAEFGFSSFDVRYTNEDGTPATQAGSKPFAATTGFDLNYSEPEFGKFVLDGELKHLIVEQVAGLTGDATAMPQCSNADFLELQGISDPMCPRDAQVGVSAARVAEDGFFLPPVLWVGGSLYNLPPPPGSLAKLGFWAFLVPVTIDIKLKPNGEYNVVAEVLNPTQILKVYGSSLQLWGTPADPGHDKLRGECGSVFFELAEDEYDFPTDGCTESIAAPQRPFLTLPRSCNGPQATAYRGAPWSAPETFVTGSVLTHDQEEPPNPQGFTGCGKLAYDPVVSSAPTTESAESGTGLDFNVDFNDEGLTNPDGLAESDSKKAVVTLPEGMTINPSVGEGLGVCTPAEYDAETLDVAPGGGCPNESKVGTLDVDTPLVDQRIEGEVFLAQQDDPGTTTPGAENPFDSLIALYFVLRNTDLGVIVKLPVLVEPDPVTGQLVTTLDDIPQVPFSHFNVHLREGVRSALVTPATCGTHTTEAKLYPHSDPDNPRTLTSSFEITSGVGGGSCPPGGVPPFEPDFQAGSLNNNAGSYSPFTMRLLRRDGDQDMTKFSSVLPPGVLGSLAGIEKCPDAAVAVAKAKTGRDELAAPSCPANSEIGDTLAGAGVGSALTYVPGKIYLAGPYKGAPLSVVAITPAVAGPFDAGTVAVRLGLDLNPKTAEVEVDGAASDPIPHILQGIVLKLRDLRVNVDRPNFTLNPTSCDESATKATIFGAYVNVFDPGDDRPVDRATRYQAANCLNLGFAPKLGLRLKGGTKRGSFPGLKSHYKPADGHANIKDLVVRLPRSAFLEQGHIRTICTRVQFAADNCPKGARYGYIRAWTPLLDEPLQGPVWLRSSNHKLPDLVFDLRGLVDVEVQTRIDSVRGGIRARVENAPDAPISRVILNMQGGKKGLIVNSRNLCTKRKGRANVKGTGQNGKQFTRRPVLRPQCGRKAKRSSHSRVSRVARASKVG